ncbi:endo-1,4-beta-xylanase [Paenibacillus sp. FSL R5-0407]|uniref:endo-1,4-beta-xylanase n=1 Tax=Paenibacillus sp. FSL R5-0407 TaxID=2975320 RepID=UPI0030FC41B9
MRRSFKQIASILLTAALLMPAGLIVRTAQAADSAAPNSVIVYHENFENGPGKATQSGSANLEAVTGKKFTGNEDGAALSVSNRSNNWDGVDFAFGDIGLAAGQEYTVTASVYVEDDYNLPQGAQVVLEVVSNKGSDDESYNGISSTAFKAGQGVSLSANLPVTNVEGTALRIKSNDEGAKVPFYIGDILITTVDSPPSSAVVLQQSFEDGAAGGWARLSWGTSGEVSVIDGIASAGTKSLKFFNRANEKAVPALALTNIVKSDRKYDISLKVRLGSDSGNFHIASKIDSDLLENKYPWIVGNKVVNALEWTTFETKGYEIPSNTKEVIIYVEPAEGNMLTSDIYIDEVIITDVTPGGTNPPEVVDKTGISADFEDGLDGFKARNGRETVVLSKEDNHTSDGSQSLLVTTTTQYDAALVDAGGKMAKNHQYELSAWVKMKSGEAPTTLRISVQYADSGFANVSPNVTVTDQQWVELKGKYTLTTTPTVLNAYVETANNDGGNRTFFLDDFKLSYLGPVAAAPPIQEGLPNIKDVYTDDFLIGNIVNPGSFDENRLKLLKKHHNVVTFENDMKPDYAYNSNRVFDFTAEDALVQRVQDAGLDLHGHVLVWHAQSPEWLHTAADGQPLSREEALENLRTHIKTVVKHFGDKVISWDVVNEAMNDNPANPQDWKKALRNSGWLKAIGDDFIEQSFLAAREVIDENGWDIKLYYNDYNDDNQNKSTAIYSMVKELNENYAKTHPGKKLVDGIGMQAHYNLGTRIDNVKSSLERFISLGVEVSITELDIMAGTNSTITDKEAQQQAYLYAQLMDLYKKNSDHIPRVTFWGLNDSTSWRAEQNPTLFDKDLQAKKAYYGVIDPEKYMEENPPQGMDAKQSKAYYGTPSIDGSVDSVWSNAPEMKLDTKQMAWSGASGTAKTLWDDKNLYVLIQVKDDKLDKSSVNVWEQDSVEVFVDENNAKSTSYQDDDGQYRVNFDNETSFNPAKIAEGFESKTSVSGTNYTVEMKIPFKTITPANNAKIGFDAQINDAKNGARISANAWNDPSGQGYQDPSVFGEVTLVGGQTPIQEDLLNIKDVYANDFLIGNIVNPATFEGNRPKLLTKHHNVVTFENDMKPDYAYNSNRVFDFAAEDALVKKVQDADLKLHGHVLVWHAQSPEWLHTGADGQPLSREEALDNLRTHIQTVMEHFGDQVISWDVVNEAMNDNPANPQEWRKALRQSGWYKAIGDDYLDQAFLAAREVLDKHPDWDIKLYYNDYNDDNQNKSTAIYSMVKELNENYAKDHPGKKLVDGIGMQAHYNLGTRIDNVKSSLERFISLGVEVSITELDIMAGSNSVLTEKEATQQGYLFAQLMDLYKKNSDHIPRVTFWGLSDGTSWRAEQNPVLFDKDLQAKKAYYGVIDPGKYMAENPPETIDVKQSKAYYGTPSIDGSVDSVWSNAPEMKLETKQMAWSGASGTAKTLWDDKNLYVLIQVNDDKLDKSSVNVWEQDSVEVFVDENNAKSTSYQDDDGQYRVTFDNETSFNPAKIAAGFESKTSVSGTNYTVEMKIPFKTITPANNAKIGFDAQINDAKNGARISVNAWNDPSGQGYQDPSVFGELTLLGKSSGGNNGGGNNGGGNNGGGSGGSGSGNSNSGNSGSGTQPGTQPGTVNNNNGVVSIQPTVKVENGNASATVSSESLNKAIGQASLGANGKKQIVIEVPNQANVQSYVVHLPASSLQSNNNVEFVLKTEYATLHVPSNMLSNMTEEAGQVSIQINKGSANDLNADARGKVGSRPIIDLSVKAGDRVLAWNNAAAPITVSLPYTPAAQELANPDQIVILYVGSQGQATVVPSGRYDSKTGAVIFTTTHFSTYAVAYVTKSFADLQNTAWAKQAVEAMAARDIIKGISDENFAPKASITRADFITLLVRALELKGSGGNAAAFSDVQPTAYYAEALAIAKELGIASGFNDNTFKPGSSISRQDMMVLTARALNAAGKQTGGQGSLDPYSDATSLAAYAKDSAASLIGSGIVNGKDGKIAPADTLTRAEAAMILYRIWKL